MSDISSFVKRIRDIMRNDAGINGDAQRIEQLAWMLFLKVYDAKEQDWFLNDDNYQSIIPENCRWSSWAHDDRTGKAMTGDTLLDFVNNTLFKTLKTLPVDATTPIRKSIVKTTFEDVNNYMKDGVLLRQVINIIDELDLDDYEERHAFGDIYESILRELQSAGSSGEFYTPRAVTDFMAQTIQPQIGEKVADFACGTGGFLTSWLKALKPKVKTTQDQALYDDSIFGIEKKPFPYILCITNLLLHGIDVPRVYHDNSLTHDVLDYRESDCFDVVLMNPPYGGNEKAEVKKHFPTSLASGETADLFMSVIMYRLKPGGRCAVILPDGFLFNTEPTKTAIKRKLLSEFNLHTVVRMPGSVFSPYTSITTNILFFDRTGPTKETWFYRLDMPEGYKHFSKTKPMKLEHFAPVVEWWNNRQEIVVDGFDKAKKFTASELQARNFDLDLCKFPQEEEEILPPHDLIQQYQEKRAALNADIDRILTSFAFSLDNGEGDGQTKTPENASPHLIKSILEMAEFPEKLKKSILQWAIQGRLVPQDPNDEPASELLKRIKAEKATLIKSGKLKPDKHESVIFRDKDGHFIEKKDGKSTDITDEIPFDIPDSWEWVRLRCIAYLQNGYAFKSEDMKIDGEIPVIRISNLQNNIACLDKSLYVSENPVLSDFLISEDDLLIAMSGATTGKIGVYKSTKKAYLNQRVGNIKLYYKTKEIQNYQYYFFLSQQKRIFDMAYGGAQPNISGNMICDLLFPLPPLAEQKRIVDKLETILPSLEFYSQSQR